MNNAKKEETIRGRQQEEKQKLLEALEKHPVVQVACKHAGISRGTYYRWLEEDREFAASVDKAMYEGEKFINDMSEAQLIELIKEKNFPPLKYWLSHHHPKYGDKLEITARVKAEEPLTPEEEALVKEALGKAALGRSKKIQTDGEAQS